MQSKNRSLNSKGETTTLPLMLKERGTLAESPFSVADFAPKHHHHDLHRSANGSTKWLQAKDGCKWRMAMLFNTPPAQHYPPVLYWSNAAATAPPASVTKRPSPGFKTKLLFFLERGAPLRVPLSPSLPFPSLSSVGTEKMRKHTEREREREREEMKQQLLPE